ncbi:MAG: inositol monophosphatase family protein [Phycisphaerales bacterium]
MTALQTDLGTVLRRLHAGVREALAGLFTSHAQEIYGTNPKGDRQRNFDLAADTTVRRILEEEFDSGIILSEESQEHYFGRAAPVYRFVVDPVDGSDNWSRRLPLSSVAVAVLPAEAPIALDQVIAALTGDLAVEDPLICIRGGPVHCGTDQIRTASTRRIKDAFVSCELNHFAPTSPLGALFASARAVRSYGCASRAIALVADGSLDAHIDVRERLTPESFLAAATILQEAGGCVVDARGNPLPAFTDLRQRTTIVAAATEELGQEIIEALTNANT